MNHTHTAFRVGKWLPSDHKVLHRWLGKLIEETSDHDGSLLPLVQEFQDLIEGESDLFMLFHLMFSQVPHKPPYNLDPTGEPQIRSYLVMLRLINRVLTRAPEFNKTVMVGCPINAILDWPMGTKAGFTAFLDSRVNRQLKEILNEWGRFLASEDSRYALNADPERGWLGRDALEAMPDFVEEYQCDPAQPFYGFKSWDDFFTRKFRDGRRPVADPEDDKVIVNACESAPYQLAHHVRLRDKFWIKAQPYSLMDMMDGDNLVEKFVGGTVYQAFLSPMTYHRWHSPVNGRVVNAYVIDGSYFAECPAEGFDPESPNASQSYLTAMASRALVFIEADDPGIGLLCLMFVGMAEVSSCQITVYEGETVKKGDQLGMFHFGGSTYCLILGPQAKVEFDLHGETPGLHSSNIRLNERLGRVVS